MTKDDIITIPHQLLKTPSKRIHHLDESIQHLAADMIAATLDWESSRQHETAAALAAVQIGQSYRMIVVRDDFEDKSNRHFNVYINPEIVRGEGEPIEGLEGCLSVANIYGSVARYPKVKIKAIDLSGKTVKVTASDFLARVFQHEIDHTNGLIFLDRIKDPHKLYRLETDGQFTPITADGKTTNEQ